VCKALRVWYTGMHTHTHGRQSLTSFPPFQLAPPKMRCMSSHPGSPWSFRLLAIVFLLALDRHPLNAAAAAIPLHATANALTCLRNGEGRESAEDFNLESLESLTSGNCMQFDDYRMAKDVYPLGRSFSVQELQCLSTTPQLVACSACYLCHHYLHHGHGLAAYKSAVLSLQHLPMQAPSASCLSALYVKRKNFLRAAFYSSGML
jgi:hypothetical protein